MKMIGFSFMAVVCLFLLSSFAAGYTGGNGMDDPYKIANVDDFLQLSTTPTDWSLSFILTADIDLAGQPFSNSPIAPDIGAFSEFQGTKFTGVFDGNGHVISKLTVTASTKDFIGLFGCVGSGGQVKNLGVENVNITGYYYVGGVAANNSGAIDTCHVTGSFSGYQCVGGLVGVNNGTISTCYASGSVSGGDYVGGLVGGNGGTLTGCYATALVSSTFDVGGLVGVNEGTITACYATGLVSGTDSVGGLVGYNRESGTITSCYATGSVSGAESVGGLMGRNQGSLTSCYATGSVSGDYRYVGGLLGDNEYGTISSCYATGSVTGTYYVGGLVGRNGDFSDPRGMLTSCYATGSARGGSYVGGLVGVNFGTLTSCYAIGAVSGTNHVGGLVNYNAGTITACFWDTQTSGQETSGGGEGKPTAQMKTLSTFTDAGWDFSTTDGDAADWQMPANCYPFLAWQIVGDIAGSYGVNFVDFAIIAAHWEQTGCPSGCDNADLNNDGTVDIEDLTLFADNWLKGI